MIAKLLGLDFGTDSVRALIVGADGKEYAHHVSYYPRWKQGLYCNPVKQQWRQHPQDYLDSMQEAILGAVQKANTSPNEIIGIGVDTTGSTPVAVDQSGWPLCYQKDMAENAHAMFILWKDHTAIQEAAEINHLCNRWDPDYSKYVGGIYSSEWFWAKILKIYREDELVKNKAYTWVEHCDWIPFVLTGGQDAHAIKRSRCASGHKAMWHASWGGLPSEDFLQALDPSLPALRSRMSEKTFTSDQSVGTLSLEWANKLGLSPHTKVAVGAFDAHMGAVGGQIQPYYLSKVMGTSTCDILVKPHDDQEKLVHGICGQVDGSVIPGMLGLEAGQSAFGDLYAWFIQILTSSFENMVQTSEWMDADIKSRLLDDFKHRSMHQLSQEAEKIPIGSDGVLTLDWMNGRRTPDANQVLKGVLSGLTIGNNAAQIFRSIIEASCYGARLIVDRFISEGIPIEGLIGLGGVAKKSPFIMQTMAHIMNRPIKIASSEQTCALGAAMFAAVAAGVHPTIEVAMDQMGAGFDHTYYPDPIKAAEYEKLYRQYQTLAAPLEEYYMNTSSINN